MCYISWTVHSKSKTDGLVSFAFLAQPKHNTCTRGEQDQLGKENKKDSAKIIIIILAHSCRERFWHPEQMLPALSPPSVTPLLPVSVPLATKFSASCSHLSIPLTTSVVLCGGRGWSTYRDLVGGVCLYVCECDIHANLKALQGPDTTFLILISFIWRKEEGESEGEKERECCSWQKIQAIGCFMALPWCVFKKQPKIWHREIFPTCFTSKYSSKASTGYRIQLWSEEYTFCWSF